MTEAWTDDGERPAQAHWTIRWFLGKLPIGFSDVLEAAQPFSVRPLAPDLFAVPVEQPPTKIVNAFVSFAPLLRETCVNGELV